MNSWLKKSFITAAGAALILTGCGSNTAGTTSGDTPEAGNAGNDTAAIKVVTTFYPMYEFTRQVAGEHADVTMLVPSGTEPHDWEPSAKEMAKIQEADVFVYNGIVEGWAEQALESTANDKRVVVEASHGLQLMEGTEGEEHDHEGEGSDAHDHEHSAESTAEHTHDHDHEAETSHDAAEHGHDHGAEAAATEAHDHASEGAEEHGHDHEHGAEGHHHDYALDPHVWLSPALAQKQVEAIRDGLISKDPAHQADYEKNAAAYVAKLQELDKEFSAQLQQAKRKEFVTQHAAFAYLAQQYGLVQVPISGLSPEQEPSPGQMAEVVSFAREHQVKTIFFETLVDPKIAQTIADEVGAKTDVLNPLEGLTAEDEQNNRDYLSIMKDNLQALVRALNEA
ncbi:metal ABC transporter substrate-binding protein [Paenibacillus massiliensis]|uniref:metal ABC transporter substrate-binding protein n=1 Tax=Paenibacillus massiliensis TaxID=225917 RepID=UPI00036CF9BC|nr:metal ABC transporter substrate-binding protein [Paenibacillus massiliensis]